LQCQNQPAVVSVITLTTAGWFWHCNLAGALYDLIDAYLAGDGERLVS